MGTTTSTVSLSLSLSLTFSLSLSLSLFLLRLISLDSTCEQGEREWKGERRREKASASLAHTSGTIAKRALASLSLSLSLSPIWASESDPGTATGDSALCSPREGAEGSEITTALTLHRHTDLLVHCNGVRYPHAYLTKGRGGESRDDVDAAWRGRARRRCARRALAGSRRARRVRLPLQRRVTEGGENL